MQWLKRFAIPFFLVSLFFNSCAYYNTFYNAKSYFAEAQKATELNKTDVVSRDEIQLYAKAIDKCKRLLTKYPDSEYRDDAQFIIAQSYFYRQDYRLARRYFEELAAQYPESPYSGEVPLWLGRCLLKQEDLVMAKHEASRTLEKDVESRIHVESYLLLGQIAIAEDSLALARHYLERVISESRDGQTRAEAQFQIGNLLKGSGDYEGALKAYQNVSRYNPNENLKIQTIIHQNRMLQKLGREHEAIDMIKAMLADDNFRDILGQLEVELGKAYFEEGWDDDAVSKFKQVMEEYRNKPVAAEASYWLGELYLNHFHQYKEATEAYGSVSYHFRKSEFSPLAELRKKQIQKYTETQTAYKNLQRELAGLPPETNTPANQNQAATSANSSRTARRPHGRVEEPPRNPAMNPDDEDQIEQPAEIPSPEAPQEEVSVAADSVDAPAATVSLIDSVGITEKMMVNRYALAEQFVFNFHFYDSTRVLLNTIETTTLDSGLMKQAAYMRYYLAAEIEHDSSAAAQAKSHIQTTYPTLYETFFVAHQKPAQPMQSEADFMAAENAFLENDREQAARIYTQIIADTSQMTSPWRERSLFNLGWLYDHYLMNQELATNYYQQFKDQYPKSDKIALVRERLRLISPKTESQENQESVSDQNQQPDDQQQDEQSENTKPPKRDRDPDKSEQK